MMGKGTYIFCYTKGEKMIDNNDSPFSDFHTYRVGCL